MKSGKKEVYKKMDNRMKVPENEKNIIPIAFRDKEVKQLDIIAQARNRSRNFIIREYVLKMIDKDYPRIDEIRKLPKEEK
jgi:hypothetical protein